MSAHVAAVDLGATSGRVIVGEVGPGELRMHTVARFPNTPVELPDGLHWNIVELYRSILDGLRDAGRETQRRSGAQLQSIGIDSWAVDYALLRRGSMLGVPFHYRDARGARAAELTHKRIPFAELYARNGLQYLPFNTVYQYVAEVLDETRIAQADRALLIPDLLGYWLTGAEVAERTNASTTGLLSLAGEWDFDLAQQFGIPTEILPPLVDPGTEIGTLRESVGEATGLDTRVPVLAVGSHDTASAVVGIPMTDPDVAFISCGTWGLVGVELEAPVVTEASRAANFTNERGVDGRTRFLHNVMGLWVLSETIRGWERADGESIDLGELLAAAAAVGAPQPVFDVNDPVFAPPGDMHARIADWLAGRGLEVPSGRAELVRSILESLAAAFADAVHRAAELSGKRVGAIHLVGGGSLNTLLCQLTADRAVLTVVAGPVEATALGNLVVQARALGAVRGDLEALRALIAQTVDLRRFTPRVSSNENY